MDVVTLDVGEWVRLGYMGEEGIEIVESIVCESPLIEQFMLLPGDYLYRIEGSGEIGGTRILKGVRVEKPEHRFEWK